MANYIAARDLKARGASIERSHLQHRDETLAKTEAAYRGHARDVLVLALCVGGFEYDAKAANRG